MLRSAPKQLILLSLIALTTVACATSSTDYYAEKERSDRNPQEYRRPIGQSVSYYDGYNEYFDPHVYHKPKPKRCERDGYTRSDAIRAYDHDPRDLQARQDDDQSGND